MTAIGSFQFPPGKTFVEVRTIEAKSKVRKEVQITSLIEHADIHAFHTCLLALQSAVEAFDRGQAKLMLHEGRFTEGRRRFFEVLPDVHHRVALAKLIVFTSDRFERGLTLHQLEHDILEGTLTVSVWNQGNWIAAPVITLTPDQSLQQITIQSGGGLFELSQEVNAGGTLVIDSVERRVQVDDQPVTPPPDLTFPMLDSGRTVLQFDSVPNTVNAQLLIQHRDIWV